MNYSKEETFSKHTVPLYFYFPAKLRPTNIEKQRVGSHKDIGITLYESILSDQEYLSFGTNLFGQSKAYAFNSNLFASNEGIIYKDQSYKWSTIPFIQKSKEENTLSELKKVYQSTLSVADYFIKLSFKKEKTRTTE